MKEQCDANGYAFICFRIFRVGLQTLVVPTMVYLADGRQHHCGQLAPIASLLAYRHRCCANFGLDGLLFAGLSPRYGRHNLSEYAGPACC